MDEPEESAGSFTHHAIIPLAKPHILHPDACNPTMDLVALLVEDDEGSGGGGSTAGPSTKVALWRMSGSKVWEADIGGRVLGLAWSRDGTYLSLLVLRFASWAPSDINDRVNKSTVEHLSVHTGEVVKSVPVPSVLFESITPDDYARSGRDPRAGWWPMEWVEGAPEWPAPKPGSSLMIIDVLPRVTPVDPPKPAIINPFALPTKAEVFKPGMHPLLTTFPALLPSTPLVAPEVLVVAARPQLGRTPGMRLLTGTFALVDGTPAPPPPSSLALAQRADALERFLDVILRGIHVCEVAFRESEKQTMIWREELEECGQQQDMTVAEVHADLFRFLMAGRCGPAVNEWLGNRMTNRTVAKWESTLATAFSTIQKVVHQSITPAVERILLILTELEGWASDISELDLVLDSATVKRAVDIARGMAMLFETMRLDAETEYAAADEWCKWLRFEMARASGSPDDAPPLPSHDLKLTWSFMKNGFVESRFRPHFPNVPEAKTDILPPTIPAPVVSTATDLDAVLRTTMAHLTSSTATTELIPSPPAFDASYSATETPPRGATPEPMSSPDTMGSPNKSRTEAPIVRVQELEPWSWANALVAQCREIITTVRPRNPAPEPPSEEDKANLSGTIVSTRTIGDEEWVVSVVRQEYMNILVLGEHLFRVASLAAPGPLLQASFFDDEELAVVYQTGTERVLCTTLVAALEQELTAPIQRGTMSPAQVLQSLTPTQLTPARSRSLGTTHTDPAAESWLVALNGRPGRRTGYVLTRGGTEVEVLDMADEEEEEEEEEVEEEVEGDVEMEDSEP